jgi:N-methylhydantoinase A
MKMPVEGERLERIFGELEARAEMRLSEDNLTDLPTSTRRSVRMKYAMQVHDIEVGIPSDLELDAAGVGVLESEFERTYESLFGAGSGYRAGGIELTSVTLRTTAEMPELTFAEDDTPKGIARSSRPVYWSTAGDFIETEVLSIESGSLPGETFAGPFLFEFPDTVVVVPPGMSARFDEDSNVVIEAGRQS